MPGLDWGSVELEHRDFLFYLFFYFLCVCIGSARDRGAALIALETNGSRFVASDCVAISPSVELDASCS